jgi:putative transcriptional regulator
MLFLSECAAGQVPKLRDAAERLGLTVQAVSHLHRDLARRGLVEQRNREYVLTVAGRAALEGTLSALAEEIGRRLEQLQIVRTTSALARRAVVAGEEVSLTLEEGLLTAVPGARAGSRGRARSGARAGELVEVAELEGIVPIDPGTLAVWVVPRGSARLEPARRRAAEALRRGRPGFVAAQGLEAVTLARRLAGDGVARFGASAACLEASRLGVDSVAFVTEEELPRFLAPFAGPRPPPITVTRLA